MLLFMMELFDDDKRNRSFEEIYNIYKQYIYKVAKYTVSDSTVMEEGIQDALLKIFLHVEKIDVNNVESTKKYIYETVRDSCKNLLKKQKRIKDKISIEELDNVPANDDLSENVEAKEAKERIIGIILDLPQKYYIVMKLNVLKCFSPAEIADELMLPLSTVYSRIGRGRKILKKGIQELINDGKI